MSQTWDLPTCDRIGLSSRTQYQPVHPHDHSSNTARYKWIPTGTSRPCVSVLHKERCPGQLSRRSAQSSSTTGRVSDNAFRPELVGGKLLCNDCEELRPKSYILRSAGNKMPPAVTGCYSPIFPCCFQKRFRGFERRYPSKFPVERWNTCTPPKYAFDTKILLN